MNFFKIFIFLIICVQVVHCSIIEYIWPVKNDNELQLESMPSVLYELSERDEKFLSEASKLIGMSMSDLDMCYHRTIMALKKSCNTLNAEQLGKLSVMFFNCQSKTEGRPIYQCTDQMTLRECTSTMDPETWNSYHLFTNRAKAVCTALRQDQFRGLTEMTVNKLMHSAQNQIEMMKKLHSDQQVLQEYTNEMIQKSDIHKEKVESNIRDLFRERSLIKAGQLEVADLLTNLKIKIDDGIQQLDSQTDKTKENHQELLTDLKKLHDNAQEIIVRLEDATNQIFLRQQEASEQYEFTLNQLKQINSTIGSLATVLNGLQEGINNKLSWISSKLGSTDNTIYHVQMILIYTGYFFFGMIILSFIKADKFVRFFFTMALPINFIATSYNVGFDLLSFTTAMIIVILTNAVFSLASSGRFNRLFLLDSRPRSPYHTEREGSEIKIKVRTVTNAKDDSENDDDFLDNEVADNNKNEKIGEKLSDVSSESNDSLLSRNSFSSSYRTSRLSLSQLTRPEVSYNRPSTPVQHGGRPITPVPLHMLNEVSMFSSTSSVKPESRCGTPYNPSMTNRLRCAGITAKGERCRNAATIGTIKCHIHNVS